METKSSVVVAGQKRRSELGLRPVVALGTVLALGARAVVASRKQTQLSRLKLYRDSPLNG
jgi:hypothetical protein